MIRLFILLLLSACNLKPKYTRPETFVTENYRFAPENSEEYANLPWWEQFDDPVLNELIKVALGNNQNIQLATATVSEFYAKYQVAFSQLFPQANAQGNAQRNKIGPNKPPVTSFFQLFGNLSYELDIWGRIRDAVTAAHADFLAQIDARYNVILTIVSGLAKAYILLLQYDNQLMLSKETLASRMTIWDIQKKRFAVGLISEMEVKQAEAQVEDAEFQVKSFEQLIPIQEDLISILMGGPPGPVPRGKLLQALKLPFSIPTGLPSDLLQYRPDILQAEQNLIASSALIGVARASFFPQFTLTGSDGQQSPFMNDLFKGINNFFNSQIAFLQPLYTGGQLRGQLYEAEAVFLENYHIYQQTVLTALQQVSDALITHQISKEELEILYKEVAALREYLRLSKLRYFNGENDYLTVTIAEQDYFAAQLQTETIRGDVFSSLIDIYTSLGQGWDVEADYCPKCDDPSPVPNALLPL